MIQAFESALAPELLGGYALAPTVLSGGLVALGLAGLAGVLFALQRLRVRHREQLVVTTLFWREALEESRAKTLVERFRHPLTYLALLLISALLWLGVARIDSSRTSGTWHTFVLDASASMAVGDRFELAVDALRTELDAAPRDRTEVIVAGAFAKTVLSPGEDRALLDSRLAGVTPEPVPSTVDSALRASMGSMDAAGDLQRRWVVVSATPADLGGFGDRGASANAVEYRIVGPEADAPAGLPNWGITALGVAPARSGAFDAVDVTAEVSGPLERRPDLSMVLVAGAAVQGTPLTASSRADGPAGRTTHTFRDVPCSSDRASRVIASLGSSAGSDALAWDDRAELALPLRDVIQVFLIPTGDATADGLLRDVLESDAAVSLAARAGDADVLVGGSGSGAARPSLELRPQADQEDAILIGVPGLDAGPATPEATLGRMAVELGLDRLDASTLAENLGASLSVGVARQPADGPRFVSLWSELLAGARPPMAESRSFPVVVGRAIRWLAGSPEIVPYRSAGRPEPRALRGGLASASKPFTERVEDLARPWPLTSRPVTAAASALGAASSSAGAASDSPAPADGPGPWRAATWILFIALILLAVEWVFFQRGRIA